MRKTILFVLAILFACTTFISCKETNTYNVKPDITQIHSICDMATLKCYYHNVAKSEKISNSWFKKDREFWIEYTGIVKVGIDMSKVNMELDENHIVVSLPEAKLLKIDIDKDSLTKDSYIMSEDGWIKNKITADDQTAAIEAAQEAMTEAVKNNRALLINAQDRARTLIENYIKQLGELSGIDYEITWVYEDTENNASQKSTEN